MRIEGQELFHFSDCLRLEGSLLSNSPMEPSCVVSSADVLTNEKQCF